MLKLIITEFQIPGQFETKADYIIALNAFLLDRLRNDMNTVLIIDEAQNLDKENLEEIRLLSNLETDTEKLLADDNDVGLDPELGKLAAAALRENRQLGFGYYVLGRIAEVEDRGDDVARAFRIATQLSPEHRDARRRDHLCRRRGNGH